MFVLHVAHGAKVKVATFGARPPHALHSLGLAEVADDVLMPHA